MKLVAIVATALFASLGLLVLAGCPNEARNDSIRAQNEGTKAYGAKQYDTAIVAYKRAVEKWSDNHPAWWGLGGVYSEKKDWTNAVEAMSHAVQLAREEAARRENKKPEEVTADLTSVNFEKPLQHLQEALKLNPDLWRAHYYIRSEEHTSELQSRVDISYA